jgi:TonB family protein
VLSIKESESVGLRMPCLPPSSKYLSVVACISFIVIGAEQAHSAGSDWINQPKPSFPTAALERNSEGVVKLRIVVTKDGAVDHAVVVKSSGNRQLDEAAQRGVLTWKMKRAAIKPTDLVQGREVLIDFKEEAAVAARYPVGSSASFNRVTDADMWRSAPFPYYPVEARMRHEEGIVHVKVKIGTNGNVERAEVVQSSGHKSLDDAAVSALQRWKAHPQYSGRTMAVPINFRMRWRSY